MFIYYTHGILPLRICPATISALSVALRPSTELPTAFGLSVFIRLRSVQCALQTHTDSIDDATDKRLVSHLPIPRKRLSYSLHLHYIPIHPAFSSFVTHLLCAVMERVFRSTFIAFLFACKHRLFHFIVINSPSVIASTVLLHCNSAALIPRRTDVKLASPTYVCHSEYLLLHYDSRPRLFILLVCLPNFPSCPLFAQYPSSPSLSVPQLHSPSFHIPAILHHMDLPFQHLPQNI